MTDSESPDLSGVSTHQLMRELSRRDESSKPKVHRFEPSDISPAVCWVCGKVEHYSIHRLQTIAERKDELDA